MSDVPSRQSDQRHLSPWMLIGGIALLAVVGAITLAVVATILAPEPSSVPSGVAQEQLADGSVLVLHAITESNTLELPDVTTASGWEQFVERLFGGGSRPKVRFNATSFGNNALTLWLARYDAQTGRPLEFDRWSHCIIRTPEGHNLWDLPYASRETRQTHPHESTSSTSSNRPFQAVDPGRYSHILYASKLPRLRSSTGQVEIDIHHADDGHFATLTAPLPGGPTSAPTWTPSPLPATASDGDVEVTLNSLTSQLHIEDPSGQHRPRHNIVVDRDVTQHGEPSELWSTQQVRLVDALGNESSTYDATLAPAEAAWKVRVRLFRSDEAALLQGPDRNRSGSATGNGGDQRLVVENIPLPDDDPVIMPNSTPHSGDPAVIDGVTLTLLGVGGPGPCEYTFKTSRGNRGTHYAGDNIETEFRPPNATLSIDNPRRHIAMKVEGDTVDHRVALLLTDQNGVLLKTDHPRQMEEARVWLFEADEWVTAVNVYVTLQLARNVEFTVAPPQPVAAE